MESTTKASQVTTAFKNINSTNTIYGTQRLALAEHVCEILTELQLNWFIESGTLLGAWRNQKLLPNDDDFDIAIVLPDSLMEGQLVQINDKLNAQLDSKYKSRMITTYCHKLEVHEPQYGKYILPDPKYNGADFHHVTVDLQVYCQQGQTVVPLYYLYMTKVSIPVSVIFPLDTITLEGKVYHSPHKTESFLEILYGYLGPDARLNVATRKYEKIK